MIQRVQTLWMLLAALAVFLTIKFSFYSGTLVVDNTYHTLSATDNFLLLILTSALGTGIIINIFLYKNRSTQSKILVGTLLLECLIIFLYIREIKNFTAGNFNLWAALHLLIIVFLVFAMQGVYRDSKIIRDSNRLR